MLVRCFNLDTGKSLYFARNTPYRAMQSLLYYLNLKARDPDAHIVIMGEGRTLSLTHKGETWSCVAN